MLKLAGVGWLWLPDRCALTGTKDKTGLWARNPLKLLRMYIYSELGLEAATSSTSDPKGSCNVVRAYICFVYK